MYDFHFIEYFFYDKKKINDNSNTKIKCKNIPINSIATIRYENVVRILCAKKLPKSRNMVTKREHLISDEQMYSRGPFESQSYACVIDSGPQGTRIDGQKLNIADMFTLLLRIATG